MYVFFFLPILFLNVLFHSVLPNLICEALMVSSDRIHGIYPSSLETLTLVILGRFLRHRTTVEREHGGVCLARQHW